MSDDSHEYDEEVFTTIGEIHDEIVVNAPLYKEGFSAGAASRDADIAMLRNAIKFWKLIEQLRDLANCLHDDLSIGCEAADRIEELEREVASRDTEVAELVADALRYRFIRDNPWNGTNLEGVITCHLSSVWDLSIDEAIRESSMK